MSSEHIHKYLRVKAGENYTVYKCVKDGCTHYVRVELAIGNNFECWRCGGVFVMNQKTLTYKKPHCSSCTRQKKQSEYKDLDMEDIQARLMRFHSGELDEI